MNRCCSFGWAVRTRDASCSKRMRRAAGASSKGLPGYIHEIQPQCISSLAQRYSLTVSQCDLWIRGSA